MTQQQPQPQQQHLDTILVRALDESDDGSALAAAVTQIWIDGLQQTVDALSWPLSTLMRWMFDKSAATATSETGDFGPQGSNLVRTWCRTPDRQFFVAVLEQQSQQQQPVVVGCVGVQRGTSFLEPSATATADSTTASIWRLSVAVSARNKGVGGALMEEAHAWARSVGCPRMALITANPVAAQFYVDKMGYEKEGWILSHNYTKKLD